MPVDKPKDSKNSNVQLHQLVSGDKVNIEYITSSGSTGVFSDIVKRTTKFDGGTQVNLENSIIYGDFYPPIVKIPNGEEYRLNKINSFNS